MPDIPYHGIIVKLVTCTLFDDPSQSSGLGIPLTAVVELRGDVARRPHSRRAEQEQLHEDPEHDRGAVHPDKLREVCRAGDVAGPDVVGGDRARVVADEVLVPDAVGARRVERVCATPAANASGATT